LLQRLTLRVIWRTVPSAFSTMLVQAGERLLDACVQMLGQALDDVATLVDLAAPEGGGHTEGVADRIAEPLRAIDDEQPGQRRIEPPGDEPNRPRPGHGRRHADRRSGRPSI
jgi:hypothetical protein